LASSVRTFRRCCIGPIRAFRRSYMKNGARDRPGLARHPQGTLNMCLAIPARIVELLAGDQCRVELGGVRKEISLALVDGAAVGDYVIVHVGYALTKLDPEEAAQTLALFAEAGIDPAGALAGDGLPTNEAAR
jgi:hydrogenase expression/formation protein HypC